MRSTTRLVLSTATQVRMAVPVRALHMSASRLSDRPATGYRWTNEELKSAERRGFENAGGKWTNSSSTFTENTFTADDVKAALEKGMEQADQYVGAALRGVYEKGFDEGKNVGIKEEKFNSDRNIRMQLQAQEDKVSERIAEASRTSYKEGLAANPDLVKAKLEARTEGENIGRKQAEIIAKTKIQAAKDTAVNEYIHNQKFSTRFNNWKNAAAERRKKAKDTQTQQTTMHGLLKEIPLILHKVKVHRLEKHKSTYHGRVYWTDGSHVERIHYQYDVDRLRIKDLAKSEVIKDKLSQDLMQATPALKYIKLYLCFILGSAATFAALFKFSQDKYDQYLHGETTEQYDTRKDLEKVCDQLEKINPEQFGTTAFTPEEEKELQKCKQGCHSFKLFNENARIEMMARRESQHGDFWFHDTTVNRTSFLENTKKLTESSIPERVKKDRKNEILASKERRYQEIKNSGLRK